MYSKPRKNRGAGLIITTMFLSMLVTVLMLIATIIPVYFEYATVLQNIKSIGQESQLSEASAREIKLLLFKRFDVNDINRVVLESLTVKKRSGTVTISVKYERKVHYVYNIDLVMNFEHTEEVSY